MTPEAFDADLICRRLLIPDNPGLVAAVGGALALLGEDENWEQAGSMSPAEAAQLMRDMLLRYYNDTGCPEDLPAEESGCTDYLADAPFISYAPQDPFQQPDLIPPGYTAPPFYHNAGIPLPGVLPGDAMVNFLTLPIGPASWLVLTSGLPRVRINLTGPGNLLIELVRVFQGGLALVTVDGSPTGASLLDLSYASIFDPALYELIFDAIIGGTTDNTLLHEVEITGAGAHFVDITFLPIIDAVSVLGFGGGLRSVRLCGFESVGVTPVPQFQIVDEHLQWRPNDAAAWLDLGDIVVNPVNQVTDMRQSAASGQLEMFRDGAWIAVPTAENVRRDGTVEMSNFLAIAKLAQAGDAAVSPMLATRRKSVAVPAVGDGQFWSMTGETATAHSLRSMFRMEARYAVIADATRRSLIEWSVYDFGGMRTFMRAEASGSAPMIGVLGAAPALRQVVTGERDANPALASLLAAFATFGWITDSTTVGTHPADGAPGAPGADGIDGVDGINGVDGVNGDDGEDGAPGTPASPGPGTIPPVDAVPFEGCLQFDLVLPASDQLVLPVRLLEGYTVEVTNVQGAASDGALSIEDVFPADLSPWRCGDGNLYALGGCLPGTATTQVGDPVPTLAHMGLLMSVGNEVSMVGAGFMYTVPAGVNDVLAVFQVNDDILSDNQGQLSFHVEVCNPVLDCADYSDPMTTDLGPRTFIADHADNSGNRQPFPGASGEFVTTGGADGQGWIRGVDHSDAVLHPGAPGSSVNELYVVVDLGRSCTVTGCSFKVLKSHGGTIIENARFMSAGGADLGGIDDVGFLPSTWNTLSYSGAPVPNVRYVQFYSETVPSSFDVGIDDIVISTEE